MEADALRTGGAQVQDADPHGPVADQPLVRPRPRPDALVDRVARGAGPRGLVHRLGHAGRRGSLPHLGRHRRALHRSRAPRGGALQPLGHGPRPRVLPRRHARDHVHRGVPRARRLLPRARRPPRFRQGGHHDDVDPRPDVRDRRDDRGIRQRAVASHAGHLQDVEARGRPGEDRRAARSRVGRRVPRGHARDRALGQRQRLVPGCLLRAVHPGAVPREPLDQRRLLAHGSPGRAVADQVPDPGDRVRR